MLNTWNTDRAEPRVEVLKPEQAQLIWSDYKAYFAALEEKVAGQSPRLQVPLLRSDRRARRDDDTRRARGKTAPNLTRPRLLNQSLC